MLDIRRRRKRYEKKKKKEKEERTKKRCRFHLLAKPRPTVTITFGDSAENHVGMEKLGNIAKEGMSVDELQSAQKKFEEKNVKCEFVDLNKAVEGVEEGKDAPKAGVLIIRNAAKLFLGKENAADELLTEQTGLSWDTQAKMYGRVVDKKARHNLCYGDFAQKPDYENGKGTVVDFTTIPLLQKIRSSLEEYLGTKTSVKKIVAEGNLYHDPSQCGIGFHGDAERRIVVALRLGVTMPLHYQWFFRGNPIGSRVILSLEHGDVYVMSEKATGFDWKKKIVPTLRHAAGSSKFTTIKEKKKKAKKAKATKATKKRKEVEETEESEESDE